jgi:exopolyphosphatase/guanosine-5'-triphosphate,3'-diphosphate pyrophosphatase
MRMAAIDVGSNSIHMIIVEAAVDGGITTLWRMKEMVGIGQASFPNRAIPRPTIERAISVLSRFHQAAQQRQCEKIVAIATSAVREASNGGDFIERIRRQIGIDVRVISGREEARLIYLGVRHAIDLGDGESLIIDIGGGSVEFIVADAHRAVFLDSRKLGAARMTNQFIKSDPLSDTDRDALLACYDAELAHPVEEILKHKPARAIGTSGTLENLALLCAGSDHDLKPDTAKPSAPPTIDRAAFQAVLENLLKTTSKDRAEMKRLDPGRKDQILAGALLVDELFKRLKLRRIQICHAALREGILVDYLSHHLPDLAIRQQLPNPRPRSVIALARRCAWHKTHSEQVARLAMRLFDQTRSLHGFGTPERELIEYAALLHDIGWHIARSGHHKHSMYLIQHGDLKNFSREEIEIIAHIARYHRKTLPKPKHLSYARLPARARKIIDTGAALLRVADGLDRSHCAVVKDLKCRISARDVKCLLQTRSDAQLELWGAARKSKWFEKIFNRPISFEVAR